MSEFSKLEAKLGIKFKDPDLCKEAFTHKSFAAEHDLKYDNQRLELLGDAVVQIILTEELFKRYPSLQEGALTKIRSALVNQDSLARFARDLGLGWKVSPSVDIQPGEVFTMANVSGMGAIKHIWLTFAACLNIAVWILNK